MKFRLPFLIVLVLFPLFNAVAFDNLSNGSQGRNNLILTPEKGNDFLNFAHNTDLKLICINHNKDLEGCLPPTYGGDFTLAANKMQIDNLIFSTSPSYTERDYFFLTSTADTYGFSINKDATSINSLNDAFHFDIASNKINKINLKNQFDSTTADDNNYTYSTIFYYLSDKNFKKDINGLNKNKVQNLLNKINLYSFNFKGSKEKSFGVMAQEINNFLPSQEYNLVLGKEENDYLKFNYHGLLALIFQSQKDNLSLSLEKEKELLEKFKNKYE